MSAYIRANAIRSLRVKNNKVAIKEEDSATKSPTSWYLGCAWLRLDHLTLESSVGISEMRLFL